MWGSEFFINNPITYGETETWIWVKLRRYSGGWITWYVDHVMPSTINRNYAVLEKEVLIQHFTLHFIFRHWKYSSANLERWQIASSVADSSWGSFIFHIIYALINFLKSVDFVSNVRLIRSEKIFLRIYLFVRTCGRSRGGARLVPRLQRVIPTEIHDEICRRSGTFIFSAKRQRHLRTSIRLRT